jgi:G-patch domain
MWKGRTQTPWRALNGHGRRALRPDTSDVVEPVADGGPRRGGGGNTGAPRRTGKRAGTRAADRPDCVVRSVCLDSSEARDDSDWLSSSSRRPPRILYCGGRVRRDCPKNHTALHWMSSEAGRKRLWVEEEEEGDGERDGRGKRARGVVISNDAAAGWSGDGVAAARPVIPLKTRTEDAEEGPREVKSLAGAAEPPLEPAEAALRAQLFRPGAKRLGPPSGGARGSLWLRGSAAEPTPRVESGPGSKLVDVDLKTFEAMPVTEFGDAVLRGMGVAEAAISAASLAPSAARLAATTQSRYRASHGAYPGLGSDRAEASKRQGPALQVGRPVLLQWGAYVGRVGLVSQTEGVPGLDRVQVRVLRSEGGGTELVSVPRDGCMLLEGAEEVMHRADLLAVGRAELAEHRRRTAELQAQRAAKAQQFISETKGAEGTAGTALPALPALPASSSSSSSTASSSSAASSSAGTWVVPGIVVRLVDPAFAGGRFFKGKGVVLDVGEGRRAVVRVSNPDGSTETVRGVPEAGLQSVVPREAGEALRVLRGVHAGRTAHLVARDKSTDAVSCLVSSDAEDELSAGALAATARRLADGSLALVPPGALLLSLPMDAVAAESRE